MASLSNCAEMESLLKWLLWLVKTLKSFLTSCLLRSVVSPLGSGSSNIRTTQFAAIVSKMKYSNFLDQELTKTATWQPILQLISVTPI